MRAAFVDAGGGDRPVDLDDAGELSRGFRFNDPDPKRAAPVGCPNVAMSPAALTIAPATPGNQRVERALSRPPLHIAARVQASRHRPRIEPAVRDFPRPLAILENHPHLCGSLVDRDLASPNTADRAVLFQVLKSAVGACGKHARARPNRG